MSMCPGGPHGPPRGGRPTSGTARGGAEADESADESVSVDKRNPYTIFAVDRIGGSPSNGRLSMPLRTIGRIDLSKTRPISKACQHVTSLIDLNISARSSERDQRILAASRSAKRALLHRERREV